MVYCYEHLRISRKTNMLELFIYYLSDPSYLIITVVTILVSYYIISKVYESPINKFKLDMKIKVNIFFRKIFVTSTIQKGASLSDFERLVDSGELNRKLFLGVSEDLQGYLIKDPIQDPGVICIGTQGSGKTTTGNGILASFQITSSHNCFIMIIDTTDKGGGDYSWLFDKENVATCLYDKRKLVAAITLARNELTERGKAARNIGSYETYMAEKKKLSEIPPEKAPGSIYEYEELFRGYISKYNEVLSKGDLSDDDEYLLRWIHDKNILRLSDSKLSNLKSFIDNKSGNKKELLYTDEYVGESLFIMVFEEFHNVVNSEEVNFLENCKVPGTLANHLFDIARTGRSWGFTLFLMSQRATYTEIPMDLKAGVKNAMVHKLGSANDAQSFSLPTTEIPPILGRIISEDGFIQFPYFKEKTRRRLLKEHSKPFQSVLFNKSPSEIRKALSGEGSDGMVDTFPLKEVIHNAGLFNLERIVSRIFSHFDFVIPDDLEGGLSINKIAVRDGEKYALVIVEPPKKNRRAMGMGLNTKSQSKEIQEEMKILGLEKCIVISFDNLSEPLKKLAEYSAGKEELLRIAEVLDKKNELVKRGMFDEFYKTLPLIRKEKTEAPDNKKKNTSDFDDDLDFMERFS